MKRVSVIVLLFVLLYGLVLGQDYQLSFSPNNATLVMGDSMTISWAGNCSVEYPTGCYDWLSVYPAAACETGAGSNTCYMTNDWVWVDNIPVDSKPEGTYQHGSWNYQFLAPGQYQFRIARCWCGGCEPVLDDMLTCSSYPTITASPIVTVKPLFTGLNTLTESEQIVMGFLWWVLTSYQVPNTNGIIQALIDATGSNRAARGGSCVSDITDIVTSFESAAEAFYQLYEDFSLPGLYTCFGDVVTVLKDVAPVLSDCDVNEWTGNDFVADILTVINDLIPGLTEAEEIIKIAIEGKPIYIETVNFFSSLEAEEYFAAGVYFGRFVETVIPLLKN